MSLFGTDRQTTIVRPIRSADVRGLMRLINSAWRVHLRVSPVELRRRINNILGFVAEDRVGIRGFMIIEPFQPGLAVMIAAGLRDTWSVEPFLDLLLPEVEKAAADAGSLALVHVGSFAWLVEGLQARGFESREWIVVLERTAPEAPFPPSRTPAIIRTAHYSDLPELTALDQLAFDHIWRKSMGHLREALAKAISFKVGLVDDNLVAYEWCELYDQHAHLTRLVVHPHYQRQGIGSQMLFQAIVDALEHGAKIITLNTQETNLRSQALYQRFDFTPTNERMPVLWKTLQ